jgi:hypothetical protein
MCKGTGCPKKVYCYRYTAPVNEYRQSYFIIVPLKEDKTCDEFWDNKDKYNAL